MDEHRLPPAGRVILISGASRGIGGAIARRLYADGYAVSLGARKPEAALAALAASDGPASDSAPAPKPERAFAHRFDALDPATAAAWVDATASRFGRIDGLVNNAGILRQVTFDTGEEADLDAMWEVNVKAPFRLIRLALPHLRTAGHGRIVNIASTDAKRYRDASVSIGYAMSKHAMLALSHAAKFAGWDDGVRVTAICPGAVDTELIAAIPGVVPGPGRIAAETIAAAVGFILTLPDNASVSEFVINPRLESTL